MLSCKDITEKANQYIDHELSFYTRVQVRVHLFICVNCRQYLKQLQLTINTLRKIPEPDQSGVREDKVSEIVSILKKEAASDKGPSGDNP